MGNADLNPDGYWNDPAVNLAMQNIFADSTEQDRLQVQSMHDNMIKSMSLWSQDQVECALAFAMNTIGFCELQ